ncbi:MAG: N-6 DNA methylase [Patescibacteria group bacterium]
MPTIKSEIEYVIQNILPLFSSQYDFPISDDSNVKIESIPITMGSGIKKPDVIYYHDGIPVFLIEAKKENESEKDAVEQALSYIRNFPTQKYSKNNIRPRFFAVTIGKNVFFYAHRFEVVENNFKDWGEKLDNPISFSELLKQYGLKKIEQKIIFNPNIFRKEILNELGPIYKFEDKISPEVVKNISLQILSFLQYEKDFTSHRPYIDLERYKDRQQMIRQIYEKFDWGNSLGQDNANEFRQYITRSFQGQINQYLTDQSIIAFMINIVGNFDSNTKVLDFECGSGGFLSAVINKGVGLEKIRGIDIDELPYTIAKTYLAIFFKKTGYEGIKSLPVYKDNGLFFQGNDWNLVIGNPAGGNKYEHGNLKKIGENLNRDLDENGKMDDNISEYNLSIQQAINSAKIGGKICLILPEGFFSNSNDEFLRKFVANHCQILAIIALPRGAFKKGTSTKNQKGGSQLSSQKMSIVYLQKTKEVNKKNPLSDIDVMKSDYSIFIANINESEVKNLPVSEWLEPQLNIIYEQWKEWQTTRNIKQLPTVKIKIEDKKTNQAPLFENEEKEKPDLKPKQIESKTKINDFLKDLFS